MTTNLSPTLLRLYQGHIFTTLDMQVRQIKPPSAASKQSHYIKLLSVTKLDRIGHCKLIGGSSVQDIHSVPHEEEEDLDGVNSRDHVLDNDSRINSQDDASGTDGLSHEARVIQTRGYRVVKDLNGFKFFCAPNNEPTELVVKGRCYVEYDAVSYNGTIHEIGDDCFTKRVSCCRIAACLLLTAREETYIAIYIAEEDHFSICKASTITNNGNNRSDIDKLATKWSNFVLHSNSKPARSNAKKPKPKAKKLTVTEDVDEIEQISSRTRSIEHNNLDMGHVASKRKRLRELDEESDSHSNEIRLNKKQNTARGPLQFTLHNEINGEDTTPGNSMVLSEVQRLAGVVASFTAQTKEQLAHMKREVETLKSEVTVKFLLIEGQFTKLSASVDAIATRHNKENDREKVLVIQSPTVRPEPNYYPPYNVHPVEYDMHYGTPAPRREYEPRYSAPPPRQDYNPRYGTPPPRQEFDNHYSTPPRHWN